MSQPETSQPESTDAHRWVSIGAVGELVFAPGHSVVVEGRELAVFELDDGLAAVDGSCPHAGGPLCEGDVDGGAVSCPWHGWSFDLRTGACAVSPASAIAAYPVRVVDGDAQVRMPKAV